MNGISTKIGVGALAGALVSLLVWVVSLFGLDIPGEQASALVVIISAVAGYITPEKASINLAEAKIEQVVTTDTSVPVESI